MTPSPWWFFPVWIVANVALLPVVYVTRSLADRWRYRHSRDSLWVVRFELVEQFMTVQQWSESRKQVVTA